MNVRRTFATSIIWTLLAVSFVYPAGAVPIVSPSPNTAVEGNAENAFPFNISDPDFGLTAQRYEQLYASSEFGASPLTISGIAFRPDATAQGAAAFSATLPSVTIKLSTSLGTIATISPTFSVNEGIDLTTVFSGALPLSSSFTGPAGGPKTFDILINLTTPFLYDPTLGNLLLEVQNFGGGITNQFDAVSGSSLVSRVFNTDNNASGTTGTANVGVGLVTQFITGPAATSVPEPFSLALFGAGLAVLSALRRRPRAKA